MHTKKFILLLGLVLIPFTLCASHFMGGELTYECLENDLYKITAKLYKDCKGAADFSSVTLNVTPSISGNTTIVLSEDTASGNDITPLCPGDSSACYGGGGTWGVLERIFTATVTIPPGTGPYIISFFSCCRNAAIKTISSPDTRSWYISTLLNPNLPSCNSSPAFINPPILYVYQNQPFVYNNGAYDVDGDSLVYSLVACQEAAGLDVPYLFPWSAAYPITSTPPASVNPTTGELSFTPTSSSEVAILAIKAEEYRNGTKIGEITRDIQVTVVPLGGSGEPDTPPTVFSATGTADTTINVLSSFCIKFKATDADTNYYNKLITMYVSTGLNPSTWSVTYTGPNQSNDSLIFCWTPSCDQVRVQPYIVTVFANDSGCPFLGTNSFTYLIYLKGAVANFTANKVCQGESTTFNNLSVNAISYQWDFGDASPPLTVTNTNPITHTYSIAGNYTTTLIVSDGGSCPDTVKYPVVVNPSPSSQFFLTPPQPLPNQIVTLTDTFISGGGLIYTWYFGDGTSITDTTSIGDSSIVATHTYSTNLSEVNICLTITNPFGCTDSVCTLTPLKPLIVFSNAFTPNGDGINDYFHPFGVAIVKLKFRIYNQWGKLVYSSDDPKIANSETNVKMGWDGTYKGRSQDIGVYVYFYDAEASDGTPFSKTGNVTLLR